MSKYLSPALASLPLVAVLCAVAGEPISSARADTLYGLTTTRQLARIDTDHPDLATVAVIEGVAQGERLLSLAYAPPSPGSLAGTLYAVGSKGTLYSIAADTARASVQGQLGASVATGLASGTFALMWTGTSSGESAGTSFSLLGSKGLNLSIILGPAGLSGVAGPSLAGAALGVSSASSVGGTVYAVNTKTSSLLELSAAGAAVSVAPLGVDTFGVSGLALGADGRGWAALLGDSGATTLYGLSVSETLLQPLSVLAQADGTPLAPIAALVQAPGLVAAAPSAVPEPSAPALALAGVVAAWFLGRRRSPRA